MKVKNVQLLELIKAKASEFGIAEEIVTYALYILSKNKELVNALDNRTEMDEYIYRAVIKNATGQRKKRATQNLESPIESERLEAEKDLSLLSREELTTDPYYRAILPIISKVVANEPILRLHADEAADIVLKLADFKRRYRATSVTEIIITRCSNELKLLADSEAVTEDDTLSTYTILA